MEQSQLFPRRTKTAVIQRSLFHAMDKAMPQLKEQDFHNNINLSPFSTGSQRNPIVSAAAFLETLRIPLYPTRGHLFSHSTQ